ncbi:MAG: CmpA/NrtA family ABC transporter substrate-binding protein [Porticoccaceae bacterium]|nr:CmpA/NrtA family ABC transporter substrate-binding protein [Porticoccaceae bacterium]
MNRTIVNKLPPAERADINLGYMRLSDSAPIILAQELGLYSDYGLDVRLHREVSWANIRDKMIAGAFDASQMLAPMGMATTLGAAGIRAPIITGLVLSLNGNGITLSSSLWNKLQIDASADLYDPLVTARALKAEIDITQRQLTFASVHNFSTHTLLLRRWLEQGGINPDQDARIIVLPPEQMVDSLAQGVIDGFCVGEPWNSIAVEYGAGVLATTGVRLWNGAPEKVLAVTEAWHSSNPGSHLRLRLALMEACRWIANMENREQVIEILSQPSYLDLPAEYLRPSLTGQLFHQRAHDLSEQIDFHVFNHLNAGFPWRSDAESMIQQFTHLLGAQINPEKTRSLVQRCFRTDLYREAAQLLNLDCPTTDYRA